MAEEIIYKKRFLNKLEKLLVYLEKEWNNTVANEYLDKLEEKIGLIKSRPTAGKITAIKNTRSILVSKHNRIYYRLNGNKIAVINMIDTRKNPKKNPFNKNT
ncbi:type II toxin-antitoxin system RelE/ParE family toxin [Ferruginibacter sp.]